MRTAAVIISLVLCVSCSRYPIIQEREYNGSIIDAQPLDKDVTVEAVLDPGDTDYYRVLSADGRPLIDITAESDGDIAFTVYATNGDEIVAVNDNVPSKGARDAEYVRNLQADDGNILIRVSRTDGNAKPYRLTVARHEPAENEEREVNDTFEAANTLVAMTNTTGYFAPARGGRHAAAADDAGIDIYRFTNPTDIMGVFSLVLSGVAGVDSALIVYDASMNVIASADSEGTGKGEAVRDLLFPQESTFFAAVVPRNRCASPLPYQLTFTSGRFSEDGEHEPNDTPACARELISGVPVEGHYDNRGDMDLFRLRIAEESANVRLCLSGVRGADALLAVTDARGRTAAEINAGGVSKGEERPNIVLTRGSYIISVTATNGFHSFAHGYSLLADIVSRSGYEREPNDTEHDATRVLAPGGVRGYIGAAGDVDLFFFEAGSLLTVDVVPPPGLDVSLAVNGPGIGTNVDMHGPRGRESVTAAFDGAYVITVRAKSGSSPEPYRLSIAEAAPKKENKAMARPRKR